MFFYRECVRAPGVAATRFWISARRSAAQISMLGSAILSAPYGACWLLARGKTVLPEADLRRPYGSVMIGVIRLRSHAGCRGSGVADGARQPGRELIGRQRAAGQVALEGLAAV